jgi:hypothetical protein
MVVNREVKLHPMLNQDWLSIGKKRS